MTREEAINEVRSWSLPKETREILEALAPELRESEDERIIRAINNMLPFIPDEAYGNNGVTKEDVLNWLEKQKEQPTDEEMLRTLRAEYEKGVADTIAKYEQKEQKEIKMEVYEVGKGTTICGQDYKCKKDYKEGNCRYIKDVIYHCSRDGYLTDQNGISWSCTPEWFKEYIQSNTEWAEEEKTRFVSGQFLQCKLSFDEFKEGGHYWLEYIGDDIYVGRSDNILNQKFHITPRQLFTLFSQELEEVQGPPQEEKQVSLNYELPFDENPSDNEIIEALIKHLKEQDGFLTAIDCVSTKAILRWLEKQKEQEEIPLMNGDADLYFDNWIQHNDTTKRGCFEEGIRYAQRLQKEQNLIMANSPQLKEQKPEDRFEEAREKYQVEWDEEDNIGWDEAFACVTRAEKAAKNEEELQNAVTAEKWLKEIKFKYYVHPVKQEWSEEDADILNCCISSIEEAKENRYAYKETDGDTSYDHEIAWLKSLRPSWKPSEEQMKALQNAVALTACDKELARLYNQLKRLI